MSARTRWLVTGAPGLLGRAVLAALAERRDAAVTPTGREQLDITDQAAVDAWVPGHHVVINTAAWADVDRAETAEAAATAVNGVAVGNLSRACAAAGALLIQVSTDHVFSGMGPGAVPEDAATAPINAYGRSKLLGEQQVTQHLPDRGYIVRTAWLYGPGRPHFATRVLRLGAAGQAVKVVDDQYGQPTSTTALARQLVDLGVAAVTGEAPPGIYHGTASGHTTWHGWAQLLFTHAGLDPTLVLPTTTDALGRPARRPPYSVLGHDRWEAAGVPVQPDWQTQTAAIFHVSGYWPPRAESTSSGDHR